MESHPWLQTAALLFGFYMAWNIGANDVANAMGTSVGSKALSLKKAVFIAAIFEFAGAFFAGSHVSETIQKGIVAPSVFAHDPMTFVYGMMGALIATGALLQLASYFGLPVSTTHAIVGAVIGFGFVIGGADAIHWQEVVWIIFSWILSPFLSAIVSFLIFSLIQRKILFALNPMEEAKKLSPYLVFLCLMVIGLSITEKWLILFFIALSFALLSHLFLQRRSKQVALQTAGGFNPYQTVSLEKALHHLQRVYLSSQDQTASREIEQIVNQLERLNDQAKKNVPFLDCSSNYYNVEKIFVALQILSACLIAFAHGANDVANAIGPVAAIISVLKTEQIALQATTPSWLLALGGGGIVIGLATWGWRVIETIGHKITELTPTRGFCAEFGAATTILIASKLGFPISTTHALIGAVLGVGMARGLRALNLQTIKEIVISWIVTIPLCASLSILAFYILKCFPW